MSDGASSPLLGGATERPSTSRSLQSNASREETPLLSESNRTPRYDGGSGQDERAPSQAAASLRSLRSDHESSFQKNRKRWPTIVAISVLAVAILVIIFSAFFAPAIAQEYVRSSMVIKPIDLSIESFTSSGVKARAQAHFTLDASRVKNKLVRNMGQFGTWVARTVESKESVVNVFLPEYERVLIGSAVVPPIVLDIRNGHTTLIDLVAVLEPQSLGDIRQVANDWLEGRLTRIKLLGEANVDLKSGLISLGSREISESFVLQGQNLPTVPKYNITKMNFSEVPVSTDGRHGMAAEVSLSLKNEFPVHLDIPALGFDILVPNCDPNEPYIPLADATTAVVKVEPYKSVNIQVGGVVREMPKTLTQNCPHTNSSPLDNLLGGYIHGSNMTIYVRGSNAPAAETPDWITEIISEVTVPVPFPAGQTFDHLIKNFSLTDSHFSLPNPFAEPGSAESSPLISGNIVVLAGIPREINFGINVTKVRATADVYYKSDKLGVLDLKEWQSAKSKRIESKDAQDEALLKIQALIEDAPLNITDDDVLTDVLQAMFFGADGVTLKIKALVDAEVSTVLGKVIIKAIPAEGLVPVKPVSLGGDGFGSLKPQIGDLQIINTEKTSLDLQAKVNFTNPTSYTAHIPYVNIHILNNGSVVGDATIENQDLGTGNNTNIIIKAIWDPARFGGEKGQDTGRELLSKYISGFNTTLTLQTHEGSIPCLPNLGRALSKFAIEIPTPRLSAPNHDGDGTGDNKTHFITEATFHLLSSSAQFILLSPLRHNVLFIESINATALYNHTDVVGTINYDLPFQVPPGSSQTPKLPVALNSVGYEALKNALGGDLKLDAVGDIGIRLEKFSELIHFVGGGIGAKIRL